MTQTVYQDDSGAILVAGNNVLKTGYDRRIRKDAMKQAKPSQPKDIRGWLTPKACKPIKTIAAMSKMWCNVMKDGLYRITHKPQPPIYWPHELKPTDEPISERKPKHHGRWWPRIRK